MSRTINFVQEIAKRAKVQDEHDLKLFRKVLVLVIILVVIWGLVVGAYAVSKWQLKKANIELKQTQNALELNQEIQNQYARFLAKVDVLTQLFTDRRNKQDALIFFRSLFTEGVTISGLVYDDSIQALTFSLTSDSVFVLERVLKKIDDPDTRAQYPNIMLVSLKRGNNGRYTLNLSVRL